MEGKFPGKLEDERKSMVMKEKKGSMKREERDVVDRGDRSE